jgi:hypothetical protein
MKDDAGKQDGYYLTGEEFRRLAAGAGRTKVRVLRHGGWDFMSQFPPGG